MEAKAVTRYKRTREDAEVVQSLLFSSLISSTRCYEKETRSDLEHGKSLFIFRATSRRRRNKPKTHKTWLPKRGWPDSILFCFIPWLLGYDGD